MNKKEVHRALRHTSLFFRYLSGTNATGSMEGLLTLTVHHELLFLPSLRQVAEPERRIAGHTIVDQAVRVGILPAQGFPSAGAVMVKQLVSVSRLDVVPITVRHVEHL